jgi:hypothetical protein
MRHLNPWFGGPLFRQNRFDQDLSLFADNGTNRMRYGVLSKFTRGTSKQRSYTCWLAGLSVRTIGLTRRQGSDEGVMWPIAFALTEFTAAQEARIGALVKKAVS